MKKLLVAPDPPPPSNPLALTSTTHAPSQYRPHNRALHQRSTPGMPMVISGASQRELI